jgi:DNA-binding NarL/FixJ family response regulator
MIRVVIADDHHLVRQGIRSLLEQETDIQIVGEAADGVEAVERVQNIKPDVLILDLSMSRMNGIQAVEQIRRRRLTTRILMLSVHTDRHLIQQALRTGANGYLLKSALLEELLLAVRAAYKGHGYLSPEISQVILADFMADRLPGDREAIPLSELTFREREVLKLIAEGNTNHRPAPDQPANGTETSDEPDGKTEYP